MNDDTRTAILIVSGICSVLVMLTVCLLVGMVIEARYAPTKQQMEFLNARESRELARDLLRGCAERP